MDQLLTEFQVGILLGWDTFANISSDLTDYGMEPCDVQGSCFELARIVTQIPPAQPRAIVSIHALIMTLQRASVTLLAVH
jgi:hypothetical protein